ncbi:MAG: hypothetical protein WAQ56_07705 [Candidatus Nitrotoga sp.]
MKATFETSATVGETHPAVIPAKAGESSLLYITTRSGQSRIEGVPTAWRYCHLSGFRPSPE